MAIKIKGTTILDDDRNLLTGNTITASSFVGPVTGNVSTGSIFTNSSGIFPTVDNTGVIGDATYTFSNGQFTNLQVDSTLQVRGAIDLADSDVLRLGTSDDWKMFHDSVANYMDLNVGDLIIRDGTTTRFTFGRTTGNITATGTINAATFNATSTTNGGFQGIDADSVTAPSFTWTADLNTGMYRHTEGSIGFTANGALAAYINNMGIQIQNNLAVQGGHIFFNSLNGTTGDYIKYETLEGLSYFENGSVKWKLSGIGNNFINGGNVGIGTETPQTKLHVAGSIRYSDQLISTVATGTAPLTVSSSTLVTNLNADLLDGVQGSGYVNVADTQTITGAKTFRATNAIRVENAATQDAIVLAGRAGGVNSRAITIVPEALAANRTYTIPDTGANDTFVLTLTAQTLVNKELSNPTIDGNITMPSYIVHTGDTNTYLGFPGNDLVTVATSGVDRLRVIANGNIGIGTTSPTALLDISGTESTAKLRLSSTDAGANVISNDSSSAALELTAAGMNASSVRYAPAIKFGSTDPHLQTVTPKFGAAIVGEASEAYGANADGGMHLVFFTVPNDPGEVSVSMSERMRINNTGQVDFKSDNGTVTILAENPSNGPEINLYGNNNSSNIMSSINQFSTGDLRIAIDPDNIAASAEFEVRIRGTNAMIVNNAGATITGTVSADSYTGNGALLTGIVESGTNANGYYVRYSDGTQHCSREVLVNSWNATISIGSVFRSDEVLAFDFPAEFVGDATHVTATLHASDNGIIRNNGIGVRLRRGQTSKSLAWAGIALITANSTTGLSTEVTNISLFAVGRWKA